MAKYNKITTTTFVWVIAGIWITGSLDNSKAEGVQLEQYLGCFYDNKTQSKSQDPVRSNENAVNRADLTVEKCIEQCHRQTDVSYARLENGRDCKCTNESGTQLPDSVCSITCEGNSTQYCGGTYQNQKQSYVLYTVCPIGTFGPRCDSTCHCQRQIPCNRQTGECPNGCHGNYTGTQCNRLNQLSSFSEQYIGCYRDNNDDRAMDWRYDPSGNSLQLCLGLCSFNYSYAGPQNGGECWCGESYDKHGRRSESDCSSPCPGNNLRICGGGHAISAYHSCPTGNYGSRCAKICNCEGRCHFNNGTCLAKRCSPGWRGDKCNKRDCSVYNGSCESDEICVDVRPLVSSTVSVCRCKSGFWRNQMWGNCTDIDECSETPGICGSFAKSCINTDGGYICHCNDSTEAVNSPCLPVGNLMSSVGVIVGAIGASLILIAILILIVILYLRKPRFPSCGILTRKDDFGQNTIIPSTRLPKGVSYEDEKNLYDQIAVYSVSSPARAEGSGELPGFILSKLSTSGLLDKEFKSVPMETKEPCSVGKNPKMKGKNRFKNIIPYDNNRVVLEKIGNNAVSDYINASYITSYNSSERFIATQGPKPETLEDFWRMVCEQDVGVIVMITNLMENRKVKCEKYWPDVGNTTSFGEISVKSQSEENWNDFTSRHLLVTNKKKSLTVVQWHFIPWPDHGVPYDAISFLNFRRRVRKCMAPGKSVVVHCSAGAGRTGCFTAIDFLIEQGRIEGRIDIFERLQNLRQMRCQMVQTLEQYQFIHRALLFSFSIGETAIQNLKFASKLRELQRINPEKGFSPLDVQYQILKDPTQDMAGINYSRVPMKTVHKNKVADMDPAFTWGWKARDAYITLIIPMSETVQDFYALCREYNCNTIILIDTEMVLDGTIFPSNQDLKLRGQIISCETSSKEDFGTAYRITERKGVDDTYANIGHFGVYANTGGDVDRRELNVLHVNESVSDDTIGFRSLFSLYRNLKYLHDNRSNKQTIVISRRGFLLTGYCLAALNAFDMSADEKEVDVFQVVQEIRKSRQQFDFSLSAFKELHSTIGQFIESSGGSNSEFC